MMNTNKLKTFARAARTKLMSLVGGKLDWVLTHKDDDAGLLGKRKEIEALHKRLAEVGREQLIDEVAYTWFNRLMALRFMDANDYTTPRVVTPADGMTLPAILQEAKGGHVDENYRVDRDRINSLLDGRTPAINNNPDQEVYRMLLVSACNYWHGAMPFMFEHISDYTELLLPDDLLSATSTVSDIREGMGIEDCQQEELIGWLYQFYIAERKEEVEPCKTSKDGLKPEEIPAATQLFTPHWIVRYMVENSLGRIWMKLHPDSRLIELMPYYIIEPAGEKTEIPTDITSIKDIRFIDPCMGSGHVLVYAFELFCKMYEEEGYSTSDIPAQIFENNLYGLDIDPRCSQLANFALTMKAQSYYRRFLRRAVKPQAMALENITEDIIAQAGRFSSDSSIHLFMQAGNLGSLISISESDFRAIKTDGGNLWSIDAKKLQVQARLLSMRYHCVVTNPPYLGKGLNKELKTFVEMNYHSSKSDLMATFMERGLEMCAEGGRVAMINQHSWMFLSSYEGLRKKLVEQSYIESLLHLGPRTFPEIGGEVVQNAAFVLGNYTTEDKGSYVRLVDFADPYLKDQKTVEAITNRSCGWFYEASQSDFEKIPGSPIGYWVSKKYRDIFSTCCELSKVHPVKKGIDTGSNNTFLRLWHEVSINKYSNINETNKWFTYIKGGDFKRWYGNFEYVVNWENDGLEIKSFKGSTIRNQTYMKKEAVTWTLISGKNGISARSVFKNCLFDNNGSSAFPERNIDYLCGFINSKVANIYLSILNPTLAFQVGNIASLPYIEADNKKINRLVSQNINITKKDYDAHETSRDFEQNELVRIRKACSTEPVSLEFLYNDYTMTWEEHFKQLHANEEELNCQFIEIYGLQDELTPDVPLSEITILQQGEIKITPDNEIKFQPNVVLKLFISYAVGCMMGRYSIDVTGLILANQGETLEEYLQRVPTPSFSPDEDAIIPVLEGEYFTDDIVERFRIFLRTAFGAEKFNVNMRFIVQYIGDLRKYLYKDFYADHIKMYKKRPIYWMFASPKKSFQALVYMHRMCSDTPSKVFSDYLQPYIHKLQEEREDLNQKRMGEDYSPRERTAATKQIEQLTKQLVDCEQYAKTLLAFASTRPTMDLDDGVRVNYTRFKDVLIPIKGLEKEE